MNRSSNDFSIKNCQLKDYHGNTQGIREPAFTRLGYDNCDMALEIHESRGPGLYKLQDRTYEDNCFQKDGGYNARELGVLAKSVDIESEIKGMNYQLSKCPSARYNPMKNCKNCDNCNLGIPCGCSHCRSDQHYKKAECDEQLISRQTKTFKPEGNISALYQDRFENLCVDVQDTSRIHSNQYIGENTRINSRDNTLKDNKVLRKDAKDKNAKYVNLDYCGPVNTPFLQSSLGCTYSEDIDKHRVLPFF